VEFVTRHRLALFSDFQDLWTSFMFNLLSNSVSIKNVAVKISNYTTNETVPGRGPLAAGEAAKLIRLVLDFQSQNTRSLYDDDTVPTLPRFEHHELGTVDRLVKRLLLEPLVSTEGTFVSPWLSVQFGIIDIFNIPLGLIEGGMGAIQSNTDNYYCAKNTTAGRKSLESMVNNLL
jgi:hypothetical protein